MYVAAVGRRRNSNSDGVAAYCVKGRLPGYPALPPGPWTAFLQEDRDALLACSSGAGGGRGAPSPRRVFYLVVCCGASKGKKVRLSPCSNGHRHSSLTCLYLTPCSLHLELGTTHISFCFIACCSAWTHSLVSRIRPPPTCACT